MRNFGYKRDENVPAHPQLKKFEAHPHAGAATPPSIDLRPCAPAVKDQGQSGSCTGHGTTTGIQTRATFAGVPLKFAPSECGVYTVGRCCERADETPKGRKLPDLEDGGTMPNAVIRGISDWGLRRRGKMPSDGRSSDCDPATINVEPDLAQLEEDAKSLAVGAYLITSTGAQRVQDVKIALASGFPVCFGVFVDTAFMQWTPDEPPIGAPNEQDPDGGGHWLCCLGYRTETVPVLDKDDRPVVDAKGRAQSREITIFVVRNSWGVNWGGGGDCEVSEAHMAAWMDIYVMDVHVKPAPQAPKKDKAKKPVSQGAKPAAAASSPKADEKAAKPAATKADDAKGGA